MNILNGYDSDEEFSFNPCDSDWIPNESILQNTKQIRDEYRIVNCIGNGSYSSVYKVENLTTHEILCAKNFFPEIVDMDVRPYSYRDISEHGKREIENLRQIQHSSILPLHGIYRGRRRGSVYIITDLYDTNLDELMRNNLLDLASIKAILHEVLSVLQTLHSRHQIHCDLKPSNILIKKGKIALCDWGSSSKIHTVSTLPTLAYRSPEMLLWRQEGSAEWWTEGLDIWSWGIILLECLTKHYFYEGESEISAVNKAVRLAGTDCISEEDRVIFEKLCESCHMHFPALSSTLDDCIKEIEKASPALYQLLRGCLGLIPRMRESAADLLKSSWWIEDPSVPNVRYLPDYSMELNRIREERKKKMMEMWKQLQGSFFIVCYTCLVVKVSRNNKFVITKWIKE